MTKNPRNRRQNTMIEMGKTYRTRDGREIRIYATDGAAFEQIHGAIKNGGVWYAAKWNADGLYDFQRVPHCDLVEADPHGILPRHRELLADVFGSLKSGDTNTLLALREKPLDELSWVVQAALIALARLDRERGE